MAIKSNLIADQIAILAVIHAPSEQEKQKVLDRLMKGGSFLAPAWLVAAINKSQKAQSCRC